MTVTRAVLVRLTAVLLLAFSLGSSGHAATGPDTYSSNEIVTAGHQFFGKVSGGLATLVERIVGRYGLPNGYIIGQEGSGAIVGGLRYGDGTFYTKAEGQRPIYWQGPSVGFDFGGDGNRTMMLVYDLPSSLSIYRRYVGVDGSAYLVGGLGMTVLANTQIPERTVYVVPIPLGRRRTARPQCRISEVHAEADLEPVLTGGSCSGAPRREPLFRLGVCGGVPELLHKPSYFAVSA
jgi:hypothetical protein